MHRRDLLRKLSVGTALGGVTLLRPVDSLAEIIQPEKPKSLNGLPPLKITDIKTILTAPNGIRLVVVKILPMNLGCTV